MYYECSHASRKIFFDFGGAPCHARAARMASTNACAFAVITAQSRLAIASLETSDDPAPTQAAPALIHSPAFLASTPPVGERRSCGSGASRSRKYPGPSAVEGKTLTISAPAV